MTRCGARIFAVLLCLTFGVALKSPVSAQASPEGSDSASDSGIALSRLQEYLKIDTTNPPGNEMAAVRFFARIFEREGISYEVAEPAPGRGNIWARLEGGPGKALILLHHLDVVPADPDFWDRDPFSGEVEDGYVHGRGALDTKSLGILHLEAFLSLARSGRKLVRPVVFLATADEEAGGALGVGWMVRERSEVFQDAGFLLNEGGGGLRFGEVPVFSVEVTQKVPLWLRLRAEGVPGHGSAPRLHSAVATLVRALARLEQHRFPARVTEPVRRYFEGLVDLQPGLGPLEDLDLRVRDPRFLRSLHVQNPSLHALLRNTCVITVLRGSPKINVVAPVAEAELDCRLLPDEDVSVFLTELQQVMAEPSLNVDVLMNFSPAISSADTILFEAIERVSLRRFPNGRVLPSVVSGFTDSHFFRDLGVVSYGFRPSMASADDASGVHGNDERLEVVDFERGLVMMQEIVEIMVLAARQPPPVSGPDGF